MKNKLMILATLLLTLLNIKKSIASCKLSNEFKAIDLNVEINEIINADYNIRRHITIAEYGPMELANKIGIKADSTIAICDNNENISFETTSGRIGLSKESDWIKTSVENLYFSVSYDGDGKGGINRKITLRDIGKITINLIQTNDIKSGSILKRGLISSLSTSDGKKLINIKYNKDNIIGSQSCMTSTPYKEIKLGRINTSSFKGRGSTAGRNNFHILIQCKDKNIPTIRFTGEVVSPSLNSIVKLHQYSEGKTAKGIGVQLLHNHNPVYMDTSLAITEWRGEKDLYYLPLTAHYYQIDDKVTGGKANATIHFTIEYK
ncbi:MULTISPECIES: fimbrial protein [Photorhabdus]|uniref:Pilin (Type 1 fimbria component protein) n=1 Tax=Photorhabdus luminescens TaxID=29488 RepID=A0A1G5R6P8_PHOLU|nr:fimbrial protein [Photorhabdus luminescens]SCZ69101.1 Pilin (type 1 fimbria component protein) [Photorhabdus luminescens]